MKRQCNLSCRALALAGTFLALVTASARAGEPFEKTYGNATVGAAVTVSSSVSKYSYFSFAGTSAYLHMAQEARLGGQLRPMIELSASASASLSSFSLFPARLIQTSSMANVQLVLGGYTADVRRYDDLITINSPETQLPGRAAHIRPDAGDTFVSAVEHKYVNLNFYYKTIRLPVNLVASSDMHLFAMAIEDPDRVHLSAKLAALGGLSVTGHVDAGQATLLNGSRVFIYQDLDFHDSELESVLNARLDRPLEGHTVLKINPGRLYLRVAARVSPWNPWQTLWMTVVNGQIAGEEVRLVDLGPVSGQFVGWQPGR